MESSVIITSSLVRFDFSESFTIMVCSGEIQPAEETALTV